MNNKILNQRDHMGGWSTVAWMFPEEPRLEHILHAVSKVARLYVYQNTTDTETLLVISICPIERAAIATGPDAHTQSGALMGWDGDKPPIREILEEVERITGVRIIEVDTCCDLCVVIVLSDQLVREHTHNLEEFAQSLFDNEGPIATTWGSAE